MDAAEIRSMRPGKVRAAPPVRRFVVIVGEPADGGSAFQIEDPVRLLRVWSLLRATLEQLQDTTLPPEGMPGVQRQLQVIRRELERAVSPPLAAELERILPPCDAAPSAGALRIECAALASWVASLVVRMLAVLVVARERGQHASPAGLAEAPAGAPTRSTAALSARSRGHWSRTGRRAASRVRSRHRPRCRDDFTVPTGTPVRSAIWR